MNIPYTLPPLPPPLTYNIFSEFAEDSPALIIQLTTATHTLLHLGIPYPDLELALTLPHATPTTSFLYRETFPQSTPQPTLTYAQAQARVQQTQDNLTQAIQRTLDVYDLLHNPS